MTCAACQRPTLQCACAVFCHVCGCRTNHTTAQHLAAEAEHGDE